MGGVIRRVLSHVSPEELLLIPAVIIVAIAILAQPTAITRLFETPYATPIPGDSPADLILGDRSPTPAPTPSPVTVEQLQRDGTPGLGWLQVGSRTFIPSGQGSLQCPGGSTLRESPVRYPDGSMDTLRTCVTADGSIVQWDTTSTRLRVIPVPGSIARP